MHNRNERQQISPVKSFLDRSEFLIGKINQESMVDVPADYNGSNLWTFASEDSLTKIEDHLIELSTSALTLLTTVRYYQVANEFQKIKTQMEK